MTPEEIIAILFEQEDSKQIFINELIATLDLHSGSELALWNEEELHSELVEIADLITQINPQ